MDSMIDELIILVAPDMPVSLETLEEKLRTSIPITHLEVIDRSSGCGENYEIMVVSEAFEKKTTLVRHRMINELLKVEISQMHAFSQTTLTPAQYETRLEKQSGA